MSRRKNQGVHSSPSTAGKQNLPPNYAERQKDTTGQIAKSKPLWERVFQLDNNYRGQWTEEELAHEMNEYFKYCYEAEAKPNKAGLCLWINISKSQFWEWSNKKEKYGFKSELANKANMMIEDSYIGRIESFPTGNIFLLKSSHGHAETSKLDITSNGKSDTDDINDLVKKLGLDKQKSE